MRMGLIQSVDGPKSKNRGFLKKREFCLKTAASNPTWVSSLPACPTDFRFVSLYNHVSQFFKISIFIYVYIHIHNTCTHT